MTIQQAEAIIQQTGVPIALRHRFAFDTGTILRLENYAMVNIFDDGRYYVQGDNTEALIAAFSQVEAPWDPDSWAGEVPKQSGAAGFPLPLPTKRFET
jgi:hypothetical protein